MPVHEVGVTDEGRPYYAMRLVRGSRTLAEALRDADGLDQRLGLLETLLRVCDTVAYAHGQGVIRRDLKPDNVALGPYGDVVVLDRGLAKAVGASPDVAETRPAGSSAAREPFQTQAGAFAWVLRDRNRALSDALDRARASRAGAIEVSNAMLVGLHERLVRIGRLDLLEASADLAGRLHSRLEPDATVDDCMRATMALRNAADVYEALGRPAEALAAYESLCAIRREVLALEPGHRGHEQKLRVASPGAATSCALSAGCGRPAPPARRRSRCASRGPGGSPPWTRSSAPRGWTTA